MASAKSGLVVAGHEGASILDNQRALSLPLITYGVPFDVLQGLQAGTNLAHVGLAVFVVRLHVRDDKSSEKPWKTSFLECHETCKMEALRPE